MVELNGHLRRINEMERFLVPHIQLYLNMPVGRQRVEFNVNGASNLGSLVRYFTNLKLMEFLVINDILVENINPEGYSELDYRCELYYFKSNKLALYFCVCVDGVGCKA